MRRRESHTYADPNPHCYANGNNSAVPYAYRNADTDGHAYCRSYSHIYAYSHGYCYIHTDCYGNLYANAQTYSLTASAPDAASQAMSADSQRSMQSTGRE